VELPLDYCREIEAYLCRKNDGHLIRITGPSFDLVSAWQADGVPFSVACRGIDRYFERYYRRGPRRRPVRVDFCDADVRDVFDEWRRAVGLVASGAEDRIGDSADGERQPTGRGASLPEHLQRAVLRLSSARADGRLGAEADPLLDRLGAALDAARASARGLRGKARRALIEQLNGLDAELVALARSVLDDQARQALEHAANEELAPFRERMPADAYVRALEAARDRLARERLGLPTLNFP
jgi:hypothetical protein